MFVFSPYDNIALTGAFFLPYYLGKCMVKPSDKVSNPFSKNLVQFYCEANE